MGNWYDDFFPFEFTADHFVLFLLIFVIVYLCYKCLEYKFMLLVRSNIIKYEKALLEKDRLIKILFKNVRYY